MVKSSTPPERLGDADGCVTSPRVTDKELDSGGLGGLTAWAPPLISVARDRVIVYSTHLAASQRGREGSRCLATFAQEQTLS